MIELVLGVVLGPAVLGWVAPAGQVLDFANFGLALLMFLAGLEMNLPRMRGRPLATAAVSWAGSLLGALAVAGVLLLAGHRHGEIVIGLSLTTTALGTLLPILRDAGVMNTAFGSHVLAIGSLAEFGPIVLVALLLGGNYPLITALLLAGFGLLAAGIAYAASRPSGRPVTDSLSRGLHSSSQLPVRAAIVLLVLLVFLATKAGLDVLLGAFAAGIVVRVRGFEPRPHIRGRDIPGQARGHRVRGIRPRVLHRQRGPPRPDLLRPPSMGAGCHSLVRRSSVAGAGRAGPDCVPERAPGPTAVVAGPVVSDWFTSDCGHHHHRNSKRLRRRSD